MLIISLLRKYHIHNNQISNIFKKYFIGYINLLEDVNNNKKVFLKH